MANSHLVILKKPFLDEVLRGRKTIESRFMHTRRPPFAAVAVGDRLLLKVTSGPVCATARVQKVMSFDNLTPERIRQIRHTYNDRIIAPAEYWTDKRHCKRGVLIWLDRVKPIEPVRIDKKDWRAWVVLTSQNNFGLWDL
ncbi:MAG TPA: ASCH domain-containing protein [Planctomycetes bacterium]|nr:ASCH domain-containing protein [Planctomycetota bacterium]